ncbi:MAG: tetratricopeptide repeat protein [Saprospiraceae bacterium]|nr:tetratricopeptide repeat protein [Saprospiraceae bacterium]
MKKNPIILIVYILSLLITACGSKENNDSEQISTTGDPAIDELTGKIEANPNDPSLYAARGGLFYEKEGYDEAIADLQKALSIDSTNVDYLHVLADVYLDYYQSRQALETMEKAVNFYPQRIPTLLKYSEFQLILKKYEDSMRTIDRILRIDPQNANAYLLFGMNFKETGDTIRAINSFQKSVELDPDLIDSWINLGQLHASIGSKLATRFFDNAILIDPKNVEALHAKADFLQDKNDLSGAIELYKQIAILDPQYEEAYFNAGLLYLDLDSIAQARQQFDFAIKVDPTFVAAYYYRGVASEFQGNVAQARADYEQALKLAPDYKQAQEALQNLE